MDINYLEGLLDSKSIDCHAKAAVFDTRVYDNGGRQTTSTYKNGVVETRSYNTENTLASISFGGTGTSIGNMTYGWDNNHNKTSETITGTMSNYGFSIPTGGYDNEDCLVSFNRTSGLSQSWSLSAVGDWNSVTTTNGTAQARTHGPTHELLTGAGSSVSSDVKGNITLIPSSLRLNTSSLTSTWDFDNRLTSATTGSTTVSHQYDALGRRVARTSGSSTTVYVQAGQQTIADYVSGAAPASSTYRYVYASYIDEPVMRWTTSSSTAVYYHRNQQYSVTALTDSSGAVLERYAYTAYGVPTIANASGGVLSSSAQNNRYTYTGREWDNDIQQYHYRARKYDPGLGRFCSRDPIGYEGGKNLYEGFSIAELDSSGNLKGNVRTVEAKLKGNCRSNSILAMTPGEDTVWAKFLFSLGRWPCRGQTGYFVQHVQGACHTWKCDPIRQAEPTRSHFEYWEAWRVDAPSEEKKRKKFKPQVQDNALYPGWDNYSGWRQQIGEVRFYCLAPTATAVLESGEISHAESTSPGKIKATEDNCYTTSGGLWGTKTEPDFWKPHREPAAVIGERHFEMDWDCCHCDDSNHISAFARPEPESEGVGLPWE